MVENRGKEVAETGVLLVNVGTPEGPTAPEVRTYLSEFLMDPHVIDIPFPLRWILVNGMILPKRASASAALYSKIWTDEGSPLLNFSKRFTKKIQEMLDREESRAEKRFFIRTAMRYGKPSIDSALGEMAERGIRDVLLFPLYPQYSLAATRSAIEETKRLAAQRIPGARVQTIGPFYDSPGFLDAFAEVTRQALDGFAFDYLLFSFHGLPEKQVKKTDRSSRHCLSRDNCCNEISEANRDCYRAQAFSTAKAIAERLNLPPNRYTVTFQSRLGRTPWIQPFTDEAYRKLPQVGIKRLAVVCPSFVADCLETLEEVQIRGREEFISSGGEELRLVPSLNDSELWCKAASEMILRKSVEE